MCTVTALLAAFVDQTQITKPALCPALTSPAPERGWTRTQSCGVECFGLGELGFGDGVGLGELGFGDGVPVAELSPGDGLVADGVDEEVPEEEEDAGAELDVPGLVEGLPLAEVREDAVVLGEADLLVLPLAELLGLADELADLLADGEELPVLVGVADELADLIGVADELASAGVGPLRGKFFVAAERTVLLGISGQAAELMID